MHHEPVLLSEIIASYQEVSPRKYVIDATQGLGGHTLALSKYLDTDGILVGIDRDYDNFMLARQNLVHQISAKNYRGIHSSFLHLGEILSQERIPHIDFILYDLWVSSAHYDDGNRGFSLRYDAELDMRFDRTRGRTARDLIMTADMETLKRWFIQYADEKKAHFIAREIVQRRMVQPIDTTFDLYRIIESVSFDKKSPIRVFQALRIAVNDEFDHILGSLQQAVDHLRVWWRIAVITFHSIEDRLVKHFFAPYLKGQNDPITGQEIHPPKLKKIPKKPIVPTQKEVIQNPRSRSAKLRILERLS